MFSRRQIRKDAKAPVKKETSEASSQPNKKPEAASKRHVRSQILASGLFAIFRSALAAFTLSLVLSTTYAVLYGNYFVLVIPVVIFLIWWRRMAFEFFLTIHVIENSLDIWPWFSLVDNDLYLGAIPIQGMHAEVLTKKLRVGAVLSLNEDFELNATTLVGTPMNLSDWKRLDVNFMQLGCPDFLPPSLTILDRGADFLDRELSEGRRVYCHCKSGVGRSASVVLAYFIKYRGMDCESAYDDLVAKRSVILKRGSRQYLQVKEYEQWLRQSR